MVFDGEKTYIVFFVTREKTCNAIFSFDELEELTGKVYASSAILFFVLWTTTSFFKEVLVGLIPIGSTVS